MDRIYRPQDLNPQDTPADDRARDRIDPLATPEELHPNAEEGHVTVSQAAGVAAEDRATEDFATPQGATDEQADPHPRSRQQTVQQTRHDEPNAPLLMTDEMNDLKAQWDNIQTAFVDEPRQAVQQADQLVALTIKKLSETFAAERRSLDQQWDRGDQASTEELRQVLRKYRSFFQRLLSV